MKRRFVPMLAALSLLTGSLLAAPSASADPQNHPNPSRGLSVYEGEVTERQLTRLHGVGLGHEAINVLRKGKPRDNKVTVEVVMSARQADKLQARGYDLEVKTIKGQTPQQRMHTLAKDGYKVFDPYSGPGGIKQQLIQITQQHPRLTKLVSAGKTIRGQKILAVKVTKHASQLPDGKRPAVLYNAAQHAREWITPEMVMRLLRHFLDGYGSNPELTRIINTTELWFLPVANPDGYDYTFTEGHRLWRKNLRDNNGDGKITNIDGVDLNRNWPYRWGYDNEGSSSNPASATYRGEKPLSEPETRALNSLFKRVGFEFMINYHSAAELLLYGVGWQVSTPTPDDVIYKAMAGTNANSAIPGYDPDISAQLYTTNGETTENVHNKYGTLAFTPEMSTCQTASRYDPNDPYEPEECVSGFNFPDSEKLVQREFEKNIPFAISVAKSAQDPDDPVSSVGLEADAFKVDSFKFSYGSPQPVAVTAKRALPVMRMKYRINGGRVQTARVHEWKGGERYGDGGNTYYAEFRGKVRGAEAGDKVEVWFWGVERSKGTIESDHFTYTVAEDSDAPVLVMANEDYNGVSPDYPDSVNAPKYTDEYTKALAANGIDTEVYDISARGAPHPLGVLSHFDAVVWEKGDNQLTQDPEDEFTKTSGGKLEDVAVAERQKYTQLAVRDYLNAGGKLLYTGETTAYYGPLGTSIDGLFYGLDGAPEAECTLTEGSPGCLVLSRDFTQYYLGAFGRTTVDKPASFTGTSGALDGAKVSFGGAAVEDNPLNNAGTFVVTSEVLPPEKFPQFASSRAGKYTGAGASPFSPVQGEWYVGSLHADTSYMRLMRTIDLTGVDSSESPKLKFQMSYEIEQGFDNIIVEAHTVGENNWTTLPDIGGATNSQVPTACARGFLLDMHPWLEHYLTLGDPCQPSGTTGEWHRFTGSSGGWQQVAFDLSRYAGEKVEVSISYVTDPASGGIGVFVDDARITVGGEPVSTQGFESGLGAWTMPGQPAGSPPNVDDFSRARGFVSPAVTTDDTVLLGFGIEQIAEPSARADLIGRVMKHLL